MGGTGSVAAERRLFDDLRAVLDRPVRVEDAAADAADAAEDEDNDDDASRGAPPRRDETMDQASQIYQQWHFTQVIEASVVTCQLVNIQDQLERAFASGKTPLVLDTSPDEKVATFYSYQLDCITLQTQGFLQPTVQPHIKRPRPGEDPMEVARRTLVNAMKNGKTLLLHMRAFAVDFARICQADDGSEDTGVFQFPREVLFQGGRLLRSDYWARKLFREGDMFPHKHVAFCRDEFRACVLSQLPLEEAYRHLFHVTRDNYLFVLREEASGELLRGWEAPLPHPRHFHIIVVDHHGAEDDGETDEAK